MWTKESIEIFMSNIGFKPRSTKLEVKELPNILSQDEELHALLEGLLKRVHNRDINGNGLVIATNKRIIFFRKSILGTITKEEIPIYKVTSSSFRKGLLLGSVAIVTSNNEAIVDHCDKLSANRFNDTVQKLLSNIGKVSIEQSFIPSKVQQTDLNQLEKLYELKQKGILTDEEYIIQKAKILA